MFNFLKPRTMWYIHVDLLLSLQFKILLNKGYSIKPRLSLRTVSSTSVGCIRPCSRDLASRPSATCRSEGRTAGTPPSSARAPSGS